MSDAQLPDAADCVLRDLLERHARERPDAVFATFEDAPEVTWAEMLRLTRSTAAGLQALGVAQGDHVLSWLPNGLDAIRVWFAINYLGAVYMPLNLDYRGGLLAHAVALSDAQVIVADPTLVPRLAEIDRAGLSTLVTLGAPVAAPPGLRALGPEALTGDPETLVPLARPIEPWDVQSVIMTSGTTGPSKAVLSSYAHLHALCRPESWAYVRDDDRFMITLPLFHIGGTACIYAMVIRGASIAMVRRFRTEGFWDAVRRTRGTVVGLMGAMTPFLMSAPPSPADRTHGLRVAVIIPLTGDIGAFAARFGVEVYTVYNMTEISTPLISDLNPTELGACGRPRPGVELRLVDEHDREVPQGEVGELTIRTTQPWALCSGYHRNPEATAAAWRNGWFHTGDAFRRRADGLYFFVDRRKDAIRRRGENISSFEVEREIAAHPAVAEVAAYPVPSEFGEDEVMVAVVPRADQALDPADLIAFAAERMPRFMVPRYVRVMADLPRTPTAKVTKHVLRAEGSAVADYDAQSRLSRAAS
ncbi:AMP-binding protein [uncultured Albimonas sp.]|uniref:AMP-binding protein n=1 Tax=uncultured Albimonas sp. TaxID=1331701 RepID=UPI0030EBD018